MKFFTKSTLLGSFAALSALLFSSCGPSGVLNQDDDSDFGNIPPAKKVTKKNSSSNTLRTVNSPSAPVFVEPQGLGSQSERTKIAKANGEEYKKYAEKTSIYGRPSDADAPPTKQELVADPDPVHAQPNNVTSPPTDG